MRLICLLSSVLVFSSGCLSPTLKGKLLSSSVSTNSSVSSFVYPLSSGNYKITDTPYFPAALNAQSIPTGIYQDGTKVLLSTVATNWGGNTNGAVNDAIEVDIINKTYLLVSSDSAGVAANDNSGAVAYSSDGKKVLFNSAGTNLVAGDVNGFTDCFMKDLVTGVTTLVSTNSAGVQGNGNSSCLSFSQDGNTVFFNSYATNLDALKVGANQDGYSKNLLTGATNMLTLTSTGLGDASGVNIFDVSQDDAYILYCTQGAMIPSDSNGNYDCFRRQLGTNNVIRVSVGSGGTQATGGQSTSARFFGSHQLIAFASSATAGLIASDTNGQYDVFVRNESTNTTFRASVDSAGTETTGGASGQWDFFALPDGKTIMMNSQASNMMAGDPGTGNDFFSKDILSGEVALLNQKFTGGFETASPGAFSNLRVAKSGQAVIYYSTATDLISGADNANGNVYLRVIY